MKKMLNKLEKIHPAFSLITIHTSYLLHNISNDLFVFNYIPIYPCFTLQNTLPARSRLSKFHLIMHRYEIIFINIVIF